MDNICLYAILFLMIYIFWRSILFVVLLVALVWIAWNRRKNNFSMKKLGENIKEKFKENAQKARQFVNF